MVISDFQNFDFLNSKILEKLKLLFKIPYLFVKEIKRRNICQNQSTIDKIHTQFHVDISISDDLRSGQVRIFQL